jgi:hypothetical protein
VRLLQRSSESAEDCSGGVLKLHWGNLLHGKPVFSQVVSCDDIALRKILLLGEFHV